MNIIPDEDALSTQQEAKLIHTALYHWRSDPQVIQHGAIIICRRGKATLTINFKEWELFEGAVITVFPGDVVHLRATDDFETETLRYNASLLREASLQLEQTVYNAMREDRCRQDTPIVTHIINNMFGLLHSYFDQPDCTCTTQIVLLQLKSFFIGFHEYLSRNPLQYPDASQTKRVRGLFDQFMKLIERDYKLSREVSHYAADMHITSKYLTTIVRQMSGHTPKTLIDHYVILQLKTQLRLSRKTIKEIAWEYHFSDASFFCRYFKRHTGISPNECRES